MPSVLHNNPTTLTASLIATFSWRGVDINIVISLLIIQTECAGGLESITGLAEDCDYNRAPRSSFSRLAGKGMPHSLFVRNRRENFTSSRFVIVSVSLKPATLLSSLVMKWCKSLTPLNTAQATMS